MIKKSVQKSLLALAVGLASGSAIAADQANRDVDVSIILEGLFYNELSSGTSSPEGFGESGHDHGHDHGHGDDGHQHGFEEGFGIGHSELAIDAGLGALLDGRLLLGFDDSDVAVEEAWVKTRSLPAGFQLKFGKFLSDIGYVNSRHTHSWDFADRPLVNQYLFGDHGLQDVGLQGTWQLPTENYALLGVELLQGQGNTFDVYAEQEDVLEEQDSGPRVVTAFMKYGPDLGADHAVQLGLSGGYANQYVGGYDKHFHGTEPHTTAQIGSSWFAGVDGVYKYSSGKAYGEGDLRLTSEYFYVARDLAQYSGDYHEEDGDYHLEGAIKGDSYTEEQDGFYVEGVYGVLPRWQVGLRAEALGLINEKWGGGHDTELDSLDTSYKYSGQITWRPVEPVFLRTQFNHKDFAGDDGSSNEVVLQFNVALGAHGAHNF
ncbi:TonB-dependent receptor [Oceanospirillum sp.]|uniref:TonB-dependent receptor n=1 Tax=Oceanospirillum sp. TaxID=2021254 RepID=UPI003A92E30F